LTTLTLSKDQKVHLPPITKD